MGRISNSAAMAIKVEALAARQHGVVTRGQMRRLGLSDDRIDSWTRRGRIYRVVSGVYALGHSRLGDWAAASELVCVDGIPCTGAARTIVDLAGTYGEKEMRETVERA
jgi:Transcriptional regulator, AbiEi antitoxin